MGKSLTLILGGARSGKSTLAQTLAAQRSSRVLYVATATAGDDEMRRRIAAHRAERPPHWGTLEARRQVGSAVLACPYPAEVILVDCLTLLANNVLMDLPEGADETQVQQTLDDEVQGLLNAYALLSAEWIVVSNEVGLGLVPPYPLGRMYRDVLGRANQRLAQAADQVAFLVAGLPMWLKGPTSPTR